MSLAPAEALLPTLEPAGDVRLPDLVNGFRTWLAASVVRLVDQAIDQGATREAAQLLESNRALFSDYEGIQALQTRLRKLSDCASSGSKSSSGSSQSPGAADCLTPREREVARLIAMGLTNKQIAEELVISRGTVMVHIKHILGRLGMTSRTQVAAWFVQRADTF